MTQVNTLKKTWWWLDWLRAFFTGKQTLHFDSSDVTDCESLEVVLSKAKENQEKITALHIQRTEIKTIPHIIRYFRNLTTLDLSHNSIQLLPWSIIYLNQLQEFDLSCNELAALPHTVGYLVNLRCLHLDNNKLKVLPQALVKLTMLKTITVTGNPLMSPPMKVSSQGVKAIFQALGSRNHRKDLWHRWSPNVNGQPEGVSQPALLTEICLQCILDNDVDYLLFSGMPPRLKTEVLHYREVENSVIHVMKCSNCKKYFSNRHYFDTHSCE